MPRSDRIMLTVTEGPGLSVAAGVTAWGVIDRDR